MVEGGVLKTMKTVAPREKLKSKYKEKNSKRNKMKKAAGTLAPGANLKQGNFAFLWFSH